MTGLVPVEHSPVPGTPPLDRAADLAQRWIITKRSPHTRFNYARDIGVPGFPRPGVKEPGTPGPSKTPAWLDYCVAIGVDPLGADLNEEHIGLWARGMEAAGLSPATVARKLSAVSSWYTWLVRRKVVAANPAEWMDRPEIDPDTSKTPGITREQAMALIRAADTAAGKQAARNAALIAVLLYTGARADEVCGATVASLGMDLGHRVLWVTRKGKKPQPLVLPPPALDRLDAYLATRAGASPLPARPGEQGAPRPLFVTDTGRPLRTAEVWEIVRRLARAAKFPPELVARLGTHAMRHSFATLYLDAGGNLRDLQDAMGHKDPRTTRRYDRARGKLERSPGYKLAEYLADEME